MQSLFSQNIIPLFSQEDWGRRGHEFTQKNFFERVGCKAHVIVYVRPQVSWLNSGWWQWRAWEKESTSIQDHIHTRRGVNCSLWASQIQCWKNNKNISNVTVRLHSNDIISDFLSVLNLSSCFKKRVENSNISLAPILIKLLIRNRKLRTPHLNEVDSILSRHLSFQGRPPWVIDQDLARHIISETYEDNIKLLNMLDSESVERMKNDPHWWDPTFYQDRKVWTDKDYEFTETELYDIVDQAIPSLIKLCLPKK